MTGTIDATRDRLPAGTRVVSKLDGEPGRVVCALRRRLPYGSHRPTTVTAYVVETSDGREVWESADIFLPA